MEFHAPFPEGYNLHRVRGKNVFLPMQSSLLIYDRHKVVVVTTGGLIDRAVPYSGRAISSHALCLRFRRKNCIYGLSYES